MNPFAYSANRMLILFDILTVFYSFVLPPRGKLGARYKHVSQKETGV